MNKINLLFVTVVTIFLLYSQSFGQIGFLDSFDSYIADQQLVCQNPTDWTTWSLTPCDSVEDPYISTNHSFSGTKSVVITEYNDLIKPLEAITSGKWYINFQVYIPNGKAGYFNTMSGFKPNPLQWAMEVYFDASGSGRLESVSGAPISFTWLENTWQMVEIFIDLDLDWAEFWFNGYLIHSWEWTQGGLVNLQLDANDFFGWYYPCDEMYIDNYLFIDVCPLRYIPPSAPSNLTAQLILNPDPQVQLNWTDNSGEEYTFNIIRKVGSPNDPGEFELIGTVLFDVTQFIDSNVMIDSTYTYGILAYNHNGYSDTSNTATITVKPIPVELTTFTASVSGNDVHLNWSTATELNNYGFEVEKTSPFPPPYQGEGGEAGGGWEKIGFVAGYGKLDLLPGTEQQQKHNITHLQITMLNRGSTNTG